LTELEIAFARLEQSQAQSQPQRPNVKTEESTSSAEAQALLTSAFAELERSRTSNVNVTTELPEPSRPLQNALQDAFAQLEHSRPTSGTANQPSVKKEPRDPPKSMANPSNLDLSDRMKELQKLQHAHRSALTESTFRPGPSAPLKSEPDNTSPSYTPRSSISRDSYTATPSRDPRFRHDVKSEPLQDYPGVKLEPHNMGMRDSASSSRTATVSGTPTPRDPRLAKRPLSPQVKREDGEVDETKRMKRRPY